MTGKKLWPPFAAGLILAGMATLGAAAIGPRVDRHTLAAIESTLNEKFRPIGQDPWELLSTARGSYLEGYGAVFTVELQLVSVPPLMPMIRMNVQPAEVESIHERKLKKLPILREYARNALASTVPALEGLPANERIALDTILWRFTWENGQGLPQHILMSAEKGKLQQAVASRGDIGAVITAVEE